jgi:transmembrane sensor
MAEPLRAEAEISVGEARWDAARAERVLGRVKRDTAKRRRHGQALGAALTLLMLLVLGVLSMKALRPVAEPQVLRHAGSLRFADGSRVDLVGEASSVEVGPMSVSYTELVLEKGAARFDVTHKPERRFAVRAGNTRVEVLGTRFTVERNDPRVRVLVEQGRVRVIWPGGERALSAGEVGWFPPDAIGSAAPEPVPVPRADGEPPSTPSVRNADRAALRSQFLELARRGEYRQAYGVMRENPSVVTNSAEDLMLAADAARLSGHPERAAEYLRRITTEHRRDSRAPLAAFTLGRILLTQLGEPAEAQRAFALTRELAPGGALAEDALAREVESAERSGQRARARALADEYSKHHPAGKRLDTVRRQGGLEPIAQ